MCFSDFYKFINPTVSISKLIKYRIIKGVFNTYNILTIASKGGFIFNKKLKASINKNTPVFKFLFDSFFSFFSYSFKIIKNFYSGSSSYNRFFFPIVIKVLFVSSRKVINKGYCLFCYPVLSFNDFFKLRNNSNDSFYSKSSNVYSFLRNKKLELGTLAYGNKHLSGFYGEVSSYNKPFDNFLKGVSIEYDFLTELGFESLNFKKLFYSGCYFGGFFNFIGSFFNNTKKDFYLGGLDDSVLFSSYNFKKSSLYWFQNRITKIESLVTKRNHFDDFFNPVKTISKSVKGVSVPLSVKKSFNYSKVKKIKSFNNSVKMPVFVKILIKRPYNYFRFIYNPKVFYASIDCFSSSYKIGYASFIKRGF